MHLANDLIPCIQRLVCYCDAQGPPSLYNQRDSHDISGLNEIQIGYTCLAKKGRLSKVLE